MTAPATHRHQVTPEERRTAAKFPIGSRVQGAPGHEGTVVAHVRGINRSQGGAVKVLWDNQTEPATMQAAGITPVTC